MGIFGRNLNDKTGTPGGRYSPLGKHRVKIKVCKERNGFKGESTIVEYEIRSSDNPEVKTGQEASWVQNYTNNAQWRDVKEGNLSDFVRVGLQTLAAHEGDYVPLEGDDKLEYNDDDLKAIFLEDQIFTGLELDLDVYAVTTGAGQPFHKHVWSSPPEVIEAAKAA